MNAMGIRVAKDYFRWAVVSKNEDELNIVAKGKMSAPKTYDEADSLAWYRERVQTIAKQHGAKMAAVRFSETFLGRGRGPTSKVLESMLMRARIEGVITEALRADGLPVGTGGWQKISARMGTRSAKAYTDSGEVRGLSIADEPEELQDAITAAISMFGK
ncbi:MAG TPA: hypothetical protein VG826_24860 [Pirellulales bacterium]|nr:hypothetical protein [Pirellulales bacterium]